MKHGSSKDATILLVDSDQLMRTVLQESLENDGYLVITAGDLGVAVDRLKDVSPDLLVIRSYINSMPGRIAAEYLRSRCPGLPVLVVAGLIDDDRIKVQHAIGDFYTFPKTFSRDELSAKVSEILKYESEKHTVRART